MKRFIAIILSAMMILTVCAYAETAQETQSAAGSEFNFRGGITWGMTPDEVRAIETGEEKSFREDGDVTALMYGYTDFSKYTADYLLYVFVNNELKEAVYIITTNPADSQYDYLSGALTQLYGEASEISNEQLNAEMSFYSGFDGSKITKANAWDTDSALVRITYDSEIDVSYMDPDFSFAAEYNTSGL